MGLRFIKSKEVYLFKEQYCDENEILIKIINDQIQKYLIPPILDVGAGIGDIAYKAFLGLETVLIDINPITDLDYPCRQSHSRKQIDFFKITGHFNTIFISHTIQFLDDSQVELNNKIVELCPEIIIIVWNKNDNFLGDLVTWILKHYPLSNPEQRISGFPPGYTQIKSITFCSTLSCANFQMLAQQISYMMLIPLGLSLDPLVKFLRKQIKAPSITFNQTIDIYQRI